MPRAMADATGDNAHLIPAGFDLIAGYVTGTPDVLWTQAEIDLYAAGRFVAIDQGGIGAPQYDATVIDVETGAWVPGQVPGWISRCTRPRPTVYCNQSTLPPVLSTGWRGDLWLAVIGWSPGQLLPAAPGCTIVAVQTAQNVAGTFDLSVVLDPTWPEEAAMGYPQLVDGFATCVKCAAVFYNKPPAPGNSNECPGGGAHDAGNPGSSFDLVIQAQGPNS